MGSSGSVAMTHATRATKNAGAESYRRSAMRVNKRPATDSIRSVATKNKNGLPSDSFFSRSVARNKNLDTTPSGSPARFKKTVNGERGKNVYLHIIIIYLYH